VWPHINPVLFCVCIVHSAEWNCIRERVALGGLIKDWITSKCMVQLKKNRRKNIFGRVFWTAYLLNSRTVLCVPGVLNLQIMKLYWCKASALTAALLPLFYWWTLSYVDPCKWRMNSVDNELPSTHNWSVVETMQSRQCISTWELGRVSCICLSLNSLCPLCAWIQVRSAMQFPVRLFPPTDVIKSFHSFIYLFDERFPRSRSHHQTLP
jgi:hypothetical protein